MKEKSIILRNLLTYISATKNRNRDGKESNNSLYK